MADLKSNLAALHSLEQLALGHSALHRVNARAKIFVTAVYVLCVASLGRYELFRLAPFLFYPVLAIAVSGIPLGMLFRRAAVALPFCLCAGVAGIFFDREPLFTLCGFEISGGLVSLLTLTSRAMLSVSAVLILVALTPFASITSELRRLHLPALFVELLEMLYRYAGVLAEEAEAMTTAFRLRSNGAKLGVTAFGAFAGQLLLRSADRAERIHRAMQCRLYGCANPKPGTQTWTAKDASFLLLVAGSSLAFRAFDLPKFLERLP